MFAGTVSQPSLAFPLAMSKDVSLDPDPELAGSDLTAAPPRVLKGVKGGALPSSPSWVDATNSASSKLQEKLSSLIADEPDWDA